jgi:surface antigen
MRSKNHIYFVLILLALVIVTTSKVVFKDKSQINPGYPTPISYDARSEPLKVIPQSEVPVGTKIDEYKGVAIYSNGTDYMSSHGLNFSDDGYYYGYKWQCVEYVKRFYYEKYDHVMADGAGHAKYFFNPMLEQGEINEQRGLYQYHNGGDVQPQVDDLLVFDDGAYGHVAIISEVGDGWLEVIQQNSEVPRERYTLTAEDGKYTISGGKKAAGWLRI